MTIYHYIALNNKGERVKGRVDAVSPREAREKIKQEKCQPLKVFEASATTKEIKKTSTNKLQPLSLKEKIDFTQTFQTLNRAGLPIIESLIFMENNASSRPIRMLSREVRQQIISGYTFSDTIARFPEIFDQIYIGLAKAGEDSGELEKTFDRIIELLKKQAAIKGKILSALMYPAFVVVLAICVVLVMLMFVFPAFKDMFEQQGKQLPAITQFCIDAGEFLKDKWISIPLGIAAIVGGAMYLLRWEPSRRRFDEFILTIPLIKDLVKSSAFSNFLTVLEVGYDAGIPIVDCLYLSNLTFSNHVMSDAIKISIKKLQSGAHLSDALKISKLFPKMILFMIATGEQSGRLGDLMHQSVIFIDQQLDTIIDTITKLIEPILLIFIGVIVCFLALSLYLPLFQSYAPS